MHCTEVERADLVCTDVERADLVCIDVERTDLVCIEVERADLVCTNVKRADLVCIDVERTDLVCTEVERADLVCIEVERADLVCNDVERADLVCTDVERTGILCTEVESADLQSQATNSADLQADVSGTTDQGTYINDLGQIANETMNVVEASEALLSLTASQKYSLLTNHYKPDPKFLFPKIFSNGCKWSFQLSWLHKYPWLVYSKELNGGFCKFCALFVVKDRNLLGVLVNKPFKNRVKVRFSCLSQVS